VRRRPLDEVAAAGAAGGLGAARRAVRLVRDGAREDGREQPVLVAAAHVRLGAQRVEDPRPAARALVRRARLDDAAVGEEPREGAGGIRESPQRHCGEAPTAEPAICS
jgi:hypothetical protein